MNKITKVLIQKKKLKLEELNFINLAFNEYPYSDEQDLIQGGSYPKHEYDWQYMKYIIATPTDVRDQCYTCGIRPQLTSKLKPIIVGDLIVRNGKGSQFNSYHVPCAIELIKEMSDKLLNTLERNKLLYQLLFEQEMRKNNE